MKKFEKVCSDICF